MSDAFGVKTDCSTVKIERRQSAEICKICGQKQKYLPRGVNMLFGTHGVHAENP
jgi:hypothetical protein